MNIKFNGSEYTLVDSLGRIHGWTRDKAKADKVAEQVKDYPFWSDIPNKIRTALAIAGFGPT